MQVIRSINNNAAICLDNKGRELVALGSGIGFGPIPHQVSLSQISRTFYGVDPKYLGLIGELPEKTLEFAAQLSDLATSSLSYELSPNLPITLADHIAFAMKRAQEHMVVQMPLAYDVQQSYPTEYRIGEMAVNGIRKTFGVRIPSSEAVGIALSIANSAVASSSSDTREQRLNDRLLEGSTRIVEHELGISVDRNSFDYARFATHLRYLIERLCKGETVATANSALYEELKKSYPRTTSCANKVADYLENSLETHLNQEERVYLALHVTRVSERSRKK